MNSKQKGTIAEQMVITLLLKEGLNVSRPIGDNLPYDIIIDNNKKLFKIQIKKATQKNGGITFYFYRSRLNTKKRYRKKYTKKEIDYFIFIDTENSKMYLFKSSTKNNNLTIRLDTSRTFQGNWNKEEPFLFKKDMLI